MQHQFFWKVWILQFFLKAKILQKKIEKLKLCNASSFEKFIFLLEYLLFKSLYFKCLAIWSQKLDFALRFQRFSPHLELQWGLYLLLLLWKIQEKNSFFGDNNIAGKTVCFLYLFLQLPILPIHHKYFPKEAILTKTDPETSSKNILNKNMNCHKKAK